MIKKFHLTTSFQKLTIRLILRRINFAIQHKQKYSSHNSKMQTVHIVGTPFVLCGTV